MKLLLFTLISLFTLQGFAQEFVCVAKSREGKKFKGVGGSLVDAKNDALNVCLQVSLVCKIIECEQIVIEDESE